MNGVFYDHAPKLAEMGYLVFPLRGKSEHLLPNGCNGASKDLATVERWAAQYPGANIGIKCENILVLDLDVKDGKDGVDDLLDIVRKLSSLPDGPESMTGSGGAHLIFKRPAVDVIGSTGVKWSGRKTGIDIRIGNQYIVAPPSIHPNGHSYQWAKSIVRVDELPEIPQAWIDGFLPIRGKRTRRNEFQPSSFFSDNRIVERAIKYLDAMPPAIQGQGGSDVLFSAVGALIWGFSLDPVTVKELIVNRFNPRCEPVWSEREIDHKIQDSLNNPMSKPKGFLLGDDSPKVSWNEFHERQGKPNETEDEIIMDEKPQNFSSVPHSTVAEGWMNGLMDGIPPTRYLVGNEDDNMNFLAFEPEAITTIGAPPGTGKSALADQLVFEAVYRNVGINALIVNVEQSPRVLLNRELARVADLPYDLIRYKKLNEIHCRDRLDAGFEIITGLGNRLNWMQYPMTIERIVEESRRLDASIVLVDYIQKITTKAAISSDHERIESVMSQLIELKNEGRSILVVSALARQTTKNGSYTSSDIGSFRGSSDLEFSSTNAFILKKADGKNGFNRFLQCLKMKEDEPVSLKMNFRGSRMSFEVVGAVGEEAEAMRPNVAMTDSGFEPWTAGDEEEAVNDEAEFTV